MSRGIHTQPNQGETTDWLTPPDIIHRIGEFSLDPCASVDQFYATADTMISRPDDGLLHTWHDYGSVWLNPPYGAKNSDLWMGRMAEHGNGVALIAARTETEWFRRYVWDAATGLLFLHGRLHYHLPDGSRAKGNAGHGSVLVAYGAKWASSLIASGIAGHVVWLGNRGAA